MKTALVCGAGGFIGNHLVRRLKEERFWVRGIDLKYPEFGKTDADEFVIGDLRDSDIAMGVLDRDFDEAYQLAADMGGAGFVFTGENDADILSHSALININFLNACVGRVSGNIFYSSSACIYPKSKQIDENHPDCEEDSAYPADPDSEYGWEKLISERLYLAYARNKRLKVHIGRYHNVFGPEGTWKGGREKAPAALCRKIAEAANGGSIEIWGDGKQTRSFLFVSDCLEATVRLTRSDFEGPVNIGSEEMLSINDLADSIVEIAGKQISKTHIAGPVGVRGRNSHNELILAKLDWQPCVSLRSGLEKTYLWIKEQVVRCGDR